MIKAVVYDDERHKGYIPNVLESIRKYKKRYKEFNFESFLDELVKGYRTLWLIFDDDKYTAFAVTQEVELLGGEKVVEVLELAGVGGLKLAHSLDSLEASLKDKDIYAIRPNGRIGWKRALKAKGYDISYVVYEKRFKK